MSLTKSQIRMLKAKAHHLKPVVSVGSKGITETLLSELDITLNTHELIKVKLGIADRDERRETADTLCQQSGAELVGTIGQIAILYRKKQD